MKKRHTKLRDTFEGNVNSLNGHHLMGLDFPDDERKNSPIQKSRRSYKKLIGY